MTGEQSKGATPLIIASYLGNYECVQQLLQHSTIDKTLTFQNKTALQWSQPNERATGWEFLEAKVNKEGRQKIRFYNYSNVLETTYNIHKTNWE